MNKLYNVGAYIRLSIENTAYANDDSMSIESQREMLSQFISVMPGWVEQKFYIDNGFSGGNFQRPAFVEMMSDVRSGEINLILVKDLSRFGRNYLETGNYLENELPSLGCRFVSLSENIDTEGGENDIMPFINAMNDYYLKNISDKIKSAMTAMAKDGQYVSGKDPYGYIRSQDERNLLVIDKEAAEVVLKMFELRADGAGYYKIAQSLNDAGYLPPMLYHCRRVNCEPPKNFVNLWKTSAIKDMLRNELYIGNMVQFKTKRISYRNKKEISRDPSEWIRVNNTHEPIISNSLWDRVQEVNRVMKDSVEKKHKYDDCKLFVGRLYCADCGRIMTAYTSKRFNKTQNRDIVTTTYLCMNYRDSGGRFCSIHSITEEALKMIVLEQVKHHANEVTLDEAKMFRSLQKQIIGVTVPSKSNSLREIKELNRNISGIDAQTEKLYENRFEGVISESEFTDLISGLEVRRQDTQTRLDVLERSDEEIQAKADDITCWVELIKEKSSVTEVDEELIGSLIDRIEVGEKAVINGKPEQNIHIYYRYVGLLM
jgi:Site-specific recombinases, DNA invertase Pin homologs